MKLDLTFYITNPILPTANDNDKGKIVFDHSLGRIGANGKWFGDSSDKLPLSGGTITGPIILNGGTVTINRSDRPAISWVHRNSGDAIEIGNTSMRLRLTSGSGGYLYHYYQGSPETYEALILDAKNTRVNNYTDNSVQYGYTLSLPQGINNTAANNANAANSTFNLLGVGMLNPSIIVDNNGQVKIKVGGEESSSAPIYASTFVGNNYFSYSDNNLYHIIGTNVSDPIEIGDGLKIEKIVHIDPNTNEEYTGGNANRPGNFHYKISIADEIISRIEALEARNTISFDNI